MEIKKRKPIDGLFRGNCTRSIIHTVPDPWHKLPVKLSGFVFRYACIIPLSTIQSPNTRVDAIIKPNVYLNPLPRVVIAINGTETLYHIFNFLFRTVFAVNILLLIYNNYVKYTTNNSYENKIKNMFLSTINYPFNVFNTPAKLFVILNSHLLYILLRIYIIKYYRKCTKIFDKHYIFTIN